MRYIILMANKPTELSQVINEFIKQHPTCKLQGGPYCDNYGHYQAITILETQQLND